MSHVAVRRSVPGNPQQARRYEGWNLWWRWVLAMTGGEFIGFAVPAIVGAAVAGLDLPQIALMISVVLAGMGEGAVLGTAQWLILRLSLEKMRWQEWVAPTALAAGFAWIIGMTPSTFVDFSTTDPVVLIAGGIVLGILFVLSMGGAQWLVLRRYIPRGGWWIAANAIAWPAGVAMPFIALGIIPDDSSVPVMIVAGIVGGILMGIVVGAITGIALVRLLRTSAPGVK